MHIRMADITPLNASIASATGARAQRERRAHGTREELPRPQRAHVNYIPGPDSLQTLIDNAVHALRKGVYWDRGSILNLLL